MKSLNWLMENLVAPESWWKPLPTIRMRMETATADMVEKAIPRWAEPSCRPFQSYDRDYYLKLTQ